MATKQVNRESIVRAMAAAGYILDESADTLSFIGGLGQRPLDFNSWEEVEEWLNDSYEPSEWFVDMFNTISGNRALFMDGFADAMASHILAAETPEEEELYREDGNDFAEIIDADSVIEAVLLYEELFTQSQIAFVNIYTDVCYDLPERSV